MPPLPPDFWDPGGPRVHLGTKNGVRKRYEKGRKIGSPRDPKMSQNRAKRSTYGSKRVLAKPLGKRL